MTTPTQREQDRALLEEIASHQRLLSSITGEEQQFWPGSPEQNHIARLYEAGYITTRSAHPFHDPRTQSIGGASHYVLTQSGQEYLEVMSPQPSPNGGNLRVFITHGKDRSYIQPAEEACRIAGFEPEVAIYAPNASQTVQQKVFSGIAQADVVVVFLTDDDGAGNSSPNAVGELHVASSQNKHVILFVAKNVTIPSNLAGLAHYPIEGQWTLHLTKELNEYRNR